MRYVEWLLERAVAILEIFSMGCIFLLVIMQVTFRFVLQNPLPWPEELSRILFIYLVFIGAVEASKDRTHIAIDLKDVFHLSAGADHFLSLFRNLLVMAVLVIMAFGAWKIIPSGYYMHLPATGFPISVMTVPILIGSVLMLFWTVLHFIRDFSALFIK